MFERVPFSALAEVNPRTELPTGLSPSVSVSFIPMSDVSESGRWETQQERLLATVSRGYTSFREGDVLVAKITPCMENGKGAHARGLVGGLGFGSTEFHVLRARPDVDPRFIYHWTRSPSLRAKAEAFMSGSAGQQRVEKEFFEKFLVVRLPLPEQRAIAAVLDSLDDALQKTEQIIAKLQQVKQGLLHDLLTRGIDDNGELRDPERHPEQFQDSPLGRIPKGWRAESLGSLVTSAVDGPFGSALKSEHYVPQPGVRLVRLQNIGSGEFIDHDHAWISQRYAETLRRHDAVSGDVLVASLGDENHPYGRACVFQDGSWAIVKADCFRLRPTGFMNSDFLAASLNIDVYHRPLRGLAQGVTRDRVNLGNLLRVRLPVPSREEQNSIINMVDSLQRRITCEQNRAQKLRSTKAGLSEDLLTGRVRTTSLPEFSA